MDQFKGKVAFITGAASGIGLGIAQALAAEGVHIAAADIEAAPLQAAEPELRAHGVSVLSIPLDVSNREAVYAAANQVSQHFGRLDILVNNAGIAYNSTPLHETEDGAIDWSYAVNTFGVLNGIKAFVPLILQGGRGGHIVNTASIGGFQVRPSKTWHQGLYASTKFAVVALSEGLRNDLAETGIGVSVLAPSLVATNIGKSDRTRPSRFGLSNRPGQQAGAGSMLGPGLDPFIVGKRTVQAIRDNEFYVFTHVEAEGILKARHRAIEAAFEKTRAFLIEHAPEELGDN